MKRPFFYFTCAVIPCVAVFFMFRLFFDFYGITFYKKYAQSEFVKFMKDSKIQPADTQMDSTELHSWQELDVRRAHPYCGFKTQPGVKMNKGYFINSLGERSDELGEKKPGVIRIAMIGGSTAFNGTSNDTTIIGLLASLLKDEGYRVEYINAGIVSGISNQELSVLVHDLLDLKVDLLISLDGDNDIAHPLNYNGRIGWPPFRWDTTSGTGPIRQQALSYYPPVEPLRDHLTPPEFDQIVQNYLNNINKIAVIAKAFGIKYLAVVQPWREFDPAQCQAKNVSPEEMFFCYASSTFTSWDHLHKQGAAFVPLVDLLADHKKMFIDSVHFNGDGNEFVAEKLFGIINARKMLPNRSN